MKKPIQGDQVISEVERRKFMEETGRTLADYSVALGYSNGDAKRFNPIGTGVLVRRGNHYGILTAHHCIHDPGPELKLGVSGGSSLYLVLQRGRSVTFQSQDVIEHPIARPKSTEFGPDLAFIEIVSASVLGSIKAIGSFWPLDTKSAKAAKLYGKPETNFAVIGFPGVHYQITIEMNTIRHIVKHMAYYYVLRKGDTYTRNGWDYIEANCWYGKNNELPATFGGVSGGPVWGFQVSRNKTDRNLFLKGFALIGIAFFETPIKRKKRRLRAHFIKSIYDRAWQNSRPDAL